MRRLEGQKEIATGGLENRAWGGVSNPERRPLNLAVSYNSHESNLGRWRRPQADTELSKLMVMEPSGRNPA